MEIKTFASKSEMAQAAAVAGAGAVRRAVEANGAANIVVATGASQIEMLAALTLQPNIPWNRVTCFHLDEYLGLPIAHPASFRRFLWERFASHLPLPVRAFHWIDGEQDAASECRRLSQIISRHVIDVAFIGIGENGHLAFNDPPADFAVEDPYIVVELDEACRRQQLGEGWFPTFDDVPRRAISMSIRQILASRRIICTVPDERKAVAVRGAVEGPITPSVPASILQEHAAATLFLDAPAASLLSRRSA
jgi:glucosamine-6-phosphate deaminase